MSRISRVRKEAEHQLISSLDSLRGPTGDKYRATGAAGYEKSWDSSGRRSHKDYNAHRIRVDHESLRVLHVAGRSTNYFGMHAFASRRDFWVSSWASRDAASPGHHSEDRANGIEGGIDRRSSPTRSIDADERKELEGYTEQK